MTITVLVRCGEGEANADLFHEIIKSTWRDYESSIQWQLPYAFVELPQNMNLSRFEKRLTGLGMTLWVATKTDEDGHSKVVYNRKEIDVVRNGIELMQFLIEMEDRKREKKR